jgi:predicted transposase/invertase (TIGR01784 family)
LNYRDSLSLIFLELPKFNKELSELETLSDKWIYFMKSAPDLEVIPESLGAVPEIEEALNVANRASLTAEELNKLERQEMLIQDRRGEIDFGKTETGSKIILLLLQQKFGEVALEIQRQIEDLSVEQLEVLAGEILGFNAVEDLQNWLESQVDM